MNKLIAAIVLCATAGFAACGEKVVSERTSVTQLLFDTKALALKLGTTRTLTAIVIPEQAASQRLEWHSDDQTIATVDPRTGVITGRGLGKTTIRVTPTGATSPEAHCTVVVLAREPYAVGDLYPDATTPQGLVFWLDPENPTEGKIVSLDEARKSWGQSKTTTSAQDSNDGQANMSAIKALDEWQSRYPAFAWCAAKGEGWYLPALNELMALYEAKEVLDEVILENGDTPFVSGDYWSSTERRISPQTTAMTVLFRYASDNESWASKDGQCAVRAIKQI